MKHLKKFLHLTIIGLLILVGFSIEAFSETTKRVNMYQRTPQGQIGPTEPGGSRDTGQKVTCILYKESGRCVFDPDIEAVQTYEIYQGTTRVGIYYDQYNFVQDAFSLRGALILTLTTRNSQLSGQIRNY